MTKQNDMNIKETVSFLFNEFISNTNKTPNNGGRNRYILLRLSYMTNSITYKKLSIKDF
jgi:hypothetical protein